MLLKLKALTHNKLLIHVSYPYMYRLPHRCSALPAVVAVVAVPSLLVAPLPVALFVSSLDVLAVLLRVRFSFFNLSLFICFWLLAQASPIGRLLRSAAALPFDHIASSGKSSE